MKKTKKLKKDKLPCYTVYEKRDILNDLEIVL